MAQRRQASVAWFVAGTLLVAAIALVDNADRTAELTNWLWQLAAVLASWLGAGPVWALLRNSARWCRRSHRRTHCRAQSIPCA